MNAMAQAQMAYSPSTFSVQTGRGVEQRAFGQVTHRLRKAIATANSEYPELVSALHANQKLWTLLAADVADDANNLPTTLRAQIFYLAEFTVQHTKKVLRGKATADALVEINLSVLRGLRSEGAS